MATSRTPNMRPVHGAQRLRGRVRGRLASRFRANDGYRRPRVTLIGTGLFALVVSTAWAIAAVSLWWVPVYLALLVLIFVTPPRRKSPPSVSKAGVECDTAGIALLSSGLRVDCGDGMDELRSLSQFDSDLTSVEPTESTDSIPNLTMTGTPKRRGRVRARKAAKLVSEPVTDTSPVAWMQVGPGKFIRVEGGIQTANSARTEEVAAREYPATETPAVAPAEAEPLDEQDSFASPGANPGDVEPIPVSDDHVLESIAEEHGIAPSDFSLAPGYDSSAKASDRELPDEVNHSPAETAEPDGVLPPAQTDLDRLLWQPRASRTWLSPIQRGIVRTTPRVNQASSRRMIRTFPNPRLLVGTSYAPNVSRRNAARRASGRMLHVQQTLRTRSPPRR